MSFKDFKDLPITNQTVSNPVRRIFVGTGDDASINTMKLMRDIIDASSRDVYVRNWAESIIDKQPRDKMQRAITIFDYLTSHCKYIYDPDGYEYMKMPKTTLQLLEAGGTPLLDCDDFTILSLSIYKTLGYPVAIRAASYTADQYLSHVYGLIEINGDWYPVDCTKPNGIGFEGAKPTRIKDMLVI